MKNCAHVTKLGNKEGSRKGRKDRERGGRIKKGKEGSRKGRKDQESEGRIKKGEEGSRQGEKKRHRKVYK